MLTLNGESEANKQCVHSINICFLYLYYFTNRFVRRVDIVAKSHYFRPSVCLFASISTASKGWFSVKYDNGKFYEDMWIKSKFR